MATQAKSVVDALNTIYPCVLTAFEQFHRQEHRFQVRYRYMVLQKRFDKLVHAARCWRRTLLNRLEALGADADSTIEKIVVEEDVKRAYEATKDLLGRIAEAIDSAVESARDGKNADHVTHKLLLGLRFEVEHKIVKVNAWLAQVADMKANYLVTLVK
jgi:hypothetical protein